MQEFGSFSTKIDAFCLFLSDYLQGGGILPKNVENSRENKQKSR